MEKQEHAIIDNENLPYKKENVEIGVGLNKVDNLMPSKYFYTAIAQSNTYNEIESQLQAYYATQNLSDMAICNEKQCDLVSIRIAKMLDENHFILSPATLKVIHKKLFSGIFTKIDEKYVGNFRDFNIAKKEAILGDKSVHYGNYDEIIEYLNYDFSAEANKNYALIKKEQWSKNIAHFIANIWQIHPFAEGNTRTIAVFTIKYLRSKGILCDNAIFKEHSKYFRNALVMANYSDIQKGIALNKVYLESFFKKLIENPSLKLEPMPQNIAESQNL
ncbi:Fic family protein [Helicobacter sp. 23-1045]